MKIVVAIDSFKGSISSLSAAEAVERGIRRVCPDAEVIKIPIADGGEGTVDALLCGAGGKRETARVKGPLGADVSAEWGLLDSGTAVIEMAAASGITLISEKERDPLRATTYGTGQLIRAALESGCRRFIVGIGGSATNDGGAGLATALGVKFLDKSGRELPPGGASLRELDKIDMSGLDARIGESEFFVACDVKNPLLGAEGASAVYGPQKGATPAMVKELDAALSRYAGVLEKTLGRDFANIPGAGAAGGLGAGLLAFCGAKLRSGIELVLDACAALEKLEGAELVFTGEGKMDASSAFGKAPVGVASLAARVKVPVIALTGCVGEGADALYEKGIGAVVPIADGPMTAGESMKNAGKLIESAAERAVRIFCLSSQRPER